MNQMQNNVKIGKVTVNIGTGKEQANLDKAIALLKHIFGKDVTPVKTTTNKRIQAWGLRPGLPVGCRLTFHGKKAVEFLSKALFAKEFVLPAKSFDAFGNFSFGIPEYIDIKDAKYSPELGILGLSVEVTLEKPGYRVKKRKYLRSKIGKNQIVAKEEAIEFMKKQFGLKLLGE